MNKISICTVCMNRLPYLCQTLPVNISENLHYPQIEFIVLDYNSKDDMENWIRLNMSYHLESGVLKYYKTYEPAHFLLSHSKNMAMRLASNDIVCMVDADNYAGPDYAGWINTAYNSTGKDRVITTLRRDDIPHRDQGGKLAFHRDFLYAAKGFDEALIGYGFEDIDLVNRLEQLGCQRMFIEDMEYLKYISHSDEERVKNFHLINNLQTLYMRISGPINIQNRVMYLLKDNTYFDMFYEFDETLNTNPILSYSGWVLNESESQKGRFKREPGVLSLASNNGTQQIYKEDSRGALISIGKGEPSVWKQIGEDNKLFTRLLLAFGECFNRVKSRKNENDHNSVNHTGWGKGTVYLNFDRQSPIHIN